jgi:hypothetical protein
MTVDHESIIIVIVELPKKTQKLIKPGNRVSPRLSQKVPFDKDEILIPTQTALIKRLPASTWTEGMMIQ